jgi:Flp pilus assembly protein TadG
MAALMKLPPAARRRGSAKRGFARDARGVAAVEAALLLPLAVVLLGLLAIWAQGIAIQRKVTLTARTVTDLVSQQPSPLKQSALDCLLDNASYVLSPYNTANMTMLVSEVQVTGVGATALVIWSEPMPGYGTARTIGSTVTLPSAIAAVGSYLIMGEVKYLYTPLKIGGGLSIGGAQGPGVVNPMTLHDEIYLSPRLSASIVELPGQ